MATAKVSAGKRVDRSRLNYKYNPSTQEEEDLSKIVTAWAWCFHMGHNDDSPPDAEAQPHKPQYSASDKIPLEAWQLAHRMFKFDFHIEHSFTATGEFLLLACGLPYKILLQEASADRCDMRMRTTKGLHDFKTEFIERYVCDEHGMPFTSTICKS